MLKSIWHIVLFLSLALHAMCLTAQTDAGDKVVTLTVSGQGITADAARQSALRNAIEQAFGTFISSHTEILNDQLVKDEIISVSNGNIQAFDVLSEVVIPEGGYASTLKATVSINRLTSFVESKGVAVEFKGALFAMNIKQQLLNEESELKAMTELADVMKQISDKSFDYFIAASEPTANGQVWNVPLTVTVKPNENLKLIPEYLAKVLAGLTMNADEVDNYRKLNKPWYSVAIRAADSNNAPRSNQTAKESRKRNKSGGLGYDVYALRNSKCIELLCGMVNHFVYSITNFNINDGASTRTLEKAGAGWMLVSKRIHDDFRPVLVYNGATVLRHFTPMDQFDLGEYRVTGSVSAPSIMEGPIACELHKEKAFPEGFRKFYYDNAEKDVFPNCGVLGNTWGSTGIALQFQDLTDAEGVCVTYRMEDRKSLEELQRLSGYTIRACEVATPLKSSAPTPAPDEASKFSAPTNAAQPVKPSGVADERIYDLKDAKDQPSFSGGMEAMYTFLNKSMKYPEMEYEAGIQGTVHVQFTVAKDGSIVDAKVLRTVSAGLDREALRVVKSMPKWNPGTIDGKPVKCRFNLPLVFKLKTP